MRRLERSRGRSEEEESVFVTMTDMTISFLLIIMILLAFFATLLNDDETVAVSVYDRVRQERDDFRVENEGLLSSLEALEAELARVISELVRTTSNLNAVTSERDRLSREMKQLRDVNEALQAQACGMDATSPVTHCAKVIFHCCSRADLDLARQRPLVAPALLTPTPWVPFVA